MNTHSRISGFGYSVPPKALSNAELCIHSDITDEWILSRTGIQSRHILEKGQTGSDLALTATLAALEQAGLSNDDITHIVYATCTPDAASPSSACVLAGRLQRKCMAVDINAACTGFIYGLELADALAARSPNACVLLVAAEALSHRCNHEDPSTAVLFGDGAGAVIITGPAASLPNKDAQGLQGAVLDLFSGSDGSKKDLLLISGGFAAHPYQLGDVVGPEYFIRMQGGAVFKHAVRNMSAACLHILERNGLRPEDVDVFIPHQANRRIIEAVGERLGIAEEKVFLNVHKYGNTSAASVPLALGEAIHQGVVRKDMRVLLASFGGGFTFGSALLQF